MPTQKILIEIYIEFPNLKFGNGVFKISLLNHKMREDVKDKR